VTHPAVSTAAKKSPAASTRFHRLPILASKVIHIDDPHRAERRRVEAFVEDVYARTFGVHLTRHYPTLMSVQDAEGRIYAVVGFRRACESSLFLEQYLDAPVEASVAGAWNDPSADRSAIVEIGHLASDGRGATVFLFLALAEHLRTMGCDYAVATATKVLRGVFDKAGIQTVELAQAQAARLPDGGRDWGSYYQTEPVVLAGSIGRSCPSLKSLVAAGPMKPAMRSRLHFGAGAEG